MHEQNGRESSILVVIFDACVRTKEQDGNKKRTAKYQMFMFNIKLMGGLEDFHAQLFFALIF